MVGIVEGPDADAAHRDAIVAGRLVHEALAAVYDTGHDEAGTWIVIEHVAGPSLADRGAIDVAPAVTLVTRVLDGLAHAHAHGLAHGHIDAGTICGPPGAEKVTGFGIPPAGDGTAGGDVADVAALLVVLLTGSPPTPARTPGWLRRAGAGMPSALEPALEDALGGMTDAAASARALRAVDVGPDDAVPLVVRDDTPPSGVRTLARRPPRRRVMPVIVLVLTLAAAAVTVVALADRDGGTAGPPIAIASATTFDPPPGDGHENDKAAPAAIDRDPTTAWSTEEYRSPVLGGLKPGVGLILHLAAPARVRALTLDTSSARWQAAVYAGTGQETTLADWGDPLVTTTEATATFDPVTTDAVLIWLTRLSPDGPRYAVRIQEAQLS